MFTDELDNSWMEEGVSVACCVELKMWLRREMSEVQRESLSEWWASDLDVWMVAV